jgi:hypothetical protein
MTKEMKERLATLRAVAPRLNAAADEAAKAYRAVERFLEELGLGIEACSSHSKIVGRGQTEDGEPTVTTEMLVYTRAGGKFQICVRTDVDIRDQDGRWGASISSEETPWSSCGRESKLKWVDALPDLLARLIDRAEELIATSEKGTAAVKDLLGSLEEGRAGDQPEKKEPSEEVVARRTARRIQKVKR